MPSKASTDDSKMTAMSSDSGSKPAESSLSTQRHNDISAVSNDTAAPSLVHKTATSNHDENHTEMVVDGAKDVSIDVQRSDVKPPGVTVTADEEVQSVKNVNMSELKEIRSDKSPSVCSQQLKVGNALHILSVIHTFICQMKLSNPFFKAKASVPGASNKLGE